MYVYIIRSRINPSEVYIGLTKDLKERLKQHNAGQTPHTAKFKPWIIETAISFTNPEKAEKFERYLKSGSGRAFRKKHF